MLRISCPWCGPRDEPEFRWGGEVPLLRPAPPEPVSEDAWAEYLFVRNNPKGWVCERWLLRKDRLRSIAGTEPRATRTAPA